MKQKQSLTFFILKNSFLFLLLTLLRFILFFLYLGTNQSSLLTIRDVYNAQKSPLYALSDSFMDDAKDKKDVRKKPKKIAVKQIVEVLLLLSNMPALGKYCVFFFFLK